MLKDIKKVFNKEYEKYGDSLITDPYIPVDGEYVIIDPYQEEFSILDKVYIKMDKKTRTIDTTNQYIDFIRRADYLSRYINSNKALKDKNIHSNNYLTFFVKKENLSNGKITNVVIEEYYNILKDPLLKYTKPRAKELYKSLEEKYDKPPIDRINKIEGWIKDNIFNLVDPGNKDKTYLKIFFKYDLNLYQQESERYILMNIYNSNDYNEIIEGRIFGLPNNNMGLNSKKPYLENKSRKVTTPHLISEEEVLSQKRLFDFLANQLALNKTNIYVGDSEIEGYTDKETLNHDFKGYYLRIQKGMEVEIHDFDIIGLYKPKIKPVNLQNILDVEKSEIQYHKITTLGELKNKIDEIFFNKFLTSNYFTEPKDMRIYDNNLKKNLLLSRTALFTWFYKGQPNNVWKILKHSSMDLIKGALSNGYLRKAGERFNLASALKTYFEGGSNMGDILKDVKNSLRMKINKNETESIENDNEYYFAIGQLTNYFISLSKSSNKVHSLANPMINAKNDLKIKDELRKLYKKYNYSISTSSIRFKNLYAMVSSYVPESKVNEELIIAGYLHSNLIYEKTNKEVNKDE